MRAILPLLLTILCALGARGAEPEAAAPPAAPTPLKLVLIGDSTVRPHSMKGTRRGWGQFLQSYFNPSVQVINDGQDGTSTKTYLAEGHWTKALAEKPDFVMIEFGNNDLQPPPDPAGTNAATDFRDNLRKFIDTARTAGAKPILVTPMRNLILRQGEVRDHLEPYAQAMKAVAAEKKVPVIDLYTSSTKLYLSLGEEGLGMLRSDPGETVHFSEAGARAIAGLLVKGIPKADSRLAAALIHSPR